MSMSLADLTSQGASGRPTRGRTPVYRVMLAGATLDVTVQEAQFTLGENMHDTGYLSVSSTDRTTTEGMLESPISFLYGLAPRTEVFCGYVQTITEEQTSNGVLSWRMTVIGPTKPMQVGVPRFWSNKTIPRAVEDLAYGGYLGYHGHDQGYVWPTLAQTSDSDWQTAVLFARRYGWSVFNRYGIVQLYDPLQLFQTQGSAFTLISETYVVARTEVDAEKSLLQFDPEEEAENAPSQQGHKVAYFNDDKVQVALQKGDHSNYSFLSDFVIRDAQEAQLYVNSDDSDASNWRQNAQARILGNASVFPGMTIEVLTTNPTYYTGKFNGRWLVRGVQHKMDRQDFQTNLILSRPGGKTQVYTGAYVPFWQTATRPRPSLTLTQTISLPSPIYAVGLTPVPQLTTEAPKTDAGVWYSSWANSNVRIVS